jgi:DNA-binding NarL/FixJ family response regulator
VVLSAVDQEDQVLGALEAGANGYLLKDDEPLNILRAVESVSAGRLYLGPGLAKRTLQHIMEDSEDHHNASPSRQSPRRLTAREIEIIRHLAQGKNGRAIACALGISDRTVRNHLTAIFAKLRVRDRTQLILYAVRVGLVRV